PAMEFTRRNLTAAAGATAATTFTRTALGGWEPSERYPDPAIQILDPSFAKYRIAQAGVERLATGMRWCEGRSISAMRAACSGAAFPTTGSCAGTRRPDAPAFIAVHRITPTATPVTGRAASSPASMTPGG